MHLRRLATASVAALLAGGALGAGSAHAANPLPTKAMAAALQIQPSMVDGVASFGVERTDIDNVTLDGVPILPSFEINGELDFQPLPAGQSFMNGDLALKPSELDPVIATAIRNGLTVQAEHQHMYDFSPMVWFVHLRAKGDPVTIAEDLHNVLAQTSTPLPQAPASHPTTPLDVKRLKRILHGYDAEVGTDGVVTVYVARRNRVEIDGVRVKPATNIATNVGFEPLNASGTKVAVIPDFAMQAKETNAVLGTMSAQGWDIGCLYNQETDESPQLFFSHQFKTGDPYQLAQEIRAGLDQTNSQ
jgi:hypothetical protein